VIHERSFLRSPRKQILLGCVLVGLLYLIVLYRAGRVPSLDDIMISMVVAIFLNFGLIPPNVRSLIVDLFLFGLSLIVWLGFFAQFVLPLHNGRERLEAVRRLFLYVTGRHGPALTIQNGEVRQRRMEGERRGSGVILLDTASASVLRTPIAFTRAVGPGTVFTTRFETIAGMVDLHKQTRRIGPREDDDPFAGQGEDESEQEFTQRQERTWETRGLTRDGVEVIPNIMTIFHLESQTGQGNTQFGYNPESVWRAIAHEGIDPKKTRDTQQHRVRWDWLPVYMAADLWREYLRKFTLSELFAFPTMQPSTVTAFETIQEFVLARMTRPSVKRLDDLGRPLSGRPAPSREFYILRDRGLEVTSVVISSLRFPAAVEDRLIEQWRADWADRADREQRLVNQQRSMERYKGEEIAIMDFGKSTSRLLGDHLLHKAQTPAQAPALKETVEMLVRGTLDHCTGDADLYPHLTNEKTDLVNLIEWIGRY